MELDASCLLLWPLAVFAFALSIALCCKSYEFRLRDLTDFGIGIRSLMPVLLQISGLIIGGTLKSGRAA